LNLERNSEQSRLGTDAGQRLWERQEHGIGTHLCEKLLFLRQYSPCIGKEAKYSINMFALIEFLGLSE
jgi:hypothetical protein